MLFSVLLVAWRLELVEMVAVELNCGEQPEDEGHRNTDRSRRYKNVIKFETQLVKQFEARDVKVSWHLLRL